MIYDCFTYSGETECLDIAINELKDLAVCHVVVQANKTFTNRPKEIHMIDIGSKWIKEVLVYDMPETNDPWLLERIQRNCIMRGLVNAQDDDIIIIRDADEVPSKSAIQMYKPEMGLTALCMDKFGYWLNCMEGEQSWELAKIMPYRYLRSRFPDEVRNGGRNTVIGRAGWHFSWLGGIDKVMNKFASFSHQEEATQKWAVKDDLEKKIEKGQSIWSDNPDDLWRIVPIDSRYPKYVQENKDGILKHLIK